MKSTPGKDHVNSAEITTKDLEYYMSFVDTIVVGFGMTADFEEKVLNCYQ